MHRWLAWSLGLIVLFAGGALAAYAFLPASMLQGLLTGSPPTEPPRGARSSANRTTVAALGRLEPKGGIVSIGVPPGDRIGRVLVIAGQEVKTGQILAYLEGHAERQAERDLSASQVTEAKARLASVTALGQAQIQEAKIKIKSIDELDPLDIKAQEAKIRVAEAQTENARRDLNRFEELKRLGTTVSQQQIDHQAVLLKQLEEELGAARIVLAKLNSGRDLGRQAAQAQLATAEANLKRFQQEIPLASLEKSLALAEARLKRFVIAAPIDGKVLKVLAREGESSGVQPLLQLADVSQMYAVAEVYETDIRLVQPGQRARVTSPALAGPLDGVVDRVGSLVSRNQFRDLDPASDADARVVEVRVRLDQSQTAAAFINLQVTVQIRVGDGG